MMKSFGFALCFVFAVGFAQSGGLLSGVLGGGSSSGSSSGGSSSPVSSANGGDLLGSLLGVTGTEPVCLVGILCDPVISIIGNLTDGQKGQLGAILADVQNLTKGQLEKRIQAFVSNLTQDVQNLYQDAVKLVDQLKNNLTSAVGTLSPAAQDLLNNLTSILDDNSLSITQELDSVLGVIRVADPSLLGAVAQLLQSLLNTLSQLLGGLPLTGLGGLLGATGVLGSVTGILGTTGLGGILSGLGL